MNEVKITVRPFMQATNVYQQAFKIVEECGEVMAELYNADRKEIINVEDIKSVGYELGDVVQATVNLMIAFGLDPNEVMQSIYDKNLSRGYYAE